MASEKPVEKTTRTNIWRISEDWLATAVGLAVILLIYLGDLTVKWPLFEWFKK